MKPVKKAIFPVAGMGTRVLPATKATPKEMLTVVDKPAIHHVVDEAKQAGIEHCIMVTGRNKGAIEDYFDFAFELETSLEQKGKTEILDAVRSAIPVAGCMSFVRQQAPLGLGHAVWCARDIVGDEPFAVVLPDVLTLGDQGCLKDCIAQRTKLGGGNIIAVEDVGHDRVENYGVITPKGEMHDGAVAMTGMVEKPPRSEAPSTLAILGRYILEPEIFDLLEKQRPGAGNEIQLTDAMDSLLDFQPFHAIQYDGNVHDIGSFVGWLRANTAFALASESIRDQYVEALGDELDKAGIKVETKGIKTS